MSNFLEDIKEALDGEKVFRIVIGGEIKDSDDAVYGRKCLPPSGNKVITWPTAKKYLDYEYDGGFGGEDCHPIYIWTETRVLFVTCYDGATWISSVPRNPEDCKPQFMGGG